MDHADLGIGAIPIGRDAVEDQPEVVFATGLERRGGDWLQIDVWFAGPDQLERLSFVLRHFMSEAAEENLDRDAGDGAGTGIGNVAIDVGDFAAGKVCRLAHDQSADGEAGGVSVRCGGDGSDTGGGRAVLEHQHHDCGGDEDYRGCNGERQPVALARLLGWDKGWKGGLRRSAHERILHPLPKEYSRLPRFDW